MTKNKPKVAQQGGGAGVMKLKVLDRIVLLNLLPQAGDYTTLGIIRKLQEQLSFSEGDHKALMLGLACETCGASKVQHKAQNLDADHPFKGQPGRLAWVSEADTGKEIKFGPKAGELIAEKLRALSDAKALTLSHMALYERFCGSNGQVADE